MKSRLAAAAIVTAMAAALLAAPSVELQAAEDDCGCELMVVLPADAARDVAHVVVAAASSEQRDTEDLVALLASLSEDDRTAMQAISDDMSEPDLWVPLLPDLVGGLGLPDGGALLPVPDNATEYSSWPLSRFLPFETMVTQPLSRLDTVENVSEAGSNVVQEAARTTFKTDAALREAIDAGKTPPTRIRAVCPDGFGYGLDFIHSGLFVKWTHRFDDGSALGASCNYDGFGGACTLEAARPMWNGGRAVVNADLEYQVIGDQFRFDPMFTTLSTSIGYDQTFTIGSTTWLSQMAASGQSSVGLIKDFDLAGSFGVGPAVPTSALWGFPDSTFVIPTVIKEEGRAVQVFVNLLGNN